MRPSGTTPESRPADQCARDAPRRRARQDGDNDQDDQADAVKQVELLLGHA
jgi:hypothetical protein